MMKNIVIFCLLLCCAAVFAIEENLTPDKVNAAALCEWLSADGYEVSVDKDGDVVCKHEDREFYVSFGEEDKIMVLGSVLEKPEGFEVAELIYWANKSMLFSTITVEDEDTKFYGNVRFFYVLQYDGGLSRKNFMISLRLFLSTQQNFLDNLQNAKKQSAASKSSAPSSSSSAGGPKGDVPVRCRTNGLMGMPNYDAAGRTVYVKNLSDETLKIHVEQDGAYGAFGISLSDATGDYTIAPRGEINFLTEVNRTLTISAPGYNPIEYIVEFQ